ncbi:uncharacterized protein LOC102809080, partial [Saccoglossus kowalevskii]|uniref:Uncharacterized protein LOC102809080 n=1 Tax=Saccoglossus kowalevskii TaxID=10224 RepID=A0ABM0MXQ9_SACKO
MDFKQISFFILCLMAVYLLRVGESRIVKIIQKNNSDDDNTGVIPIGGEENEGTHENEREGTGHVNDIESCLEPSEQELHRRMMRKEKSYPHSPAFTLFAGSDSTSRNSINSVHGQRHTYPTPNFTCPLHLNVSLSADIAARSLCPWTYTIDSDPDRFPKVMAVASCRCKDCIDASVRGGLSVVNTCETVTYLVRVLKRTGCRDGFYQYKFAWEHVPVACVCVRPKVF